MPYARITPELEDVLIGLQRKLTEALDTFGRQVKDGELVLGSFTAMDFRTSALANVLGVEVYRCCADPVHLAGSLQMVADAFAREQLAARVEEIRRRGFAGFPTSPWPRRPPSAL